MYRWIVSLTESARTAVVRITNTNASESDRKTDSTYSAQSVQQMPLQVSNETRDELEELHERVAELEAQLMVHQTLDGEWTDVEKRPVTVEARVAQEREEIIDTREGAVVAEPGDVVIRGVEGEVYPCDPAVFEKSYRVPDVHE